jgi:hypothetical protein
MSLQLSASDQDLLMTSEQVKRIASCIVRVSTSLYGADASGDELDL